MDGSDNQSNKGPLWRGLTWLTGYSGLPYLSRPTFRYEQAGIIASCLGLSVAIGGFCLFFAKKGLSVPDWMLAALVASPAAGSLAGALLTETLRRWRQPVVIAGCMFLAAAMTATVALLPATEASGSIFTVLMVLVATLMMVSVQARAAVWQANYPRGGRGGIVSRNFIMQTILGVVLIQSLCALLDWRTDLYRLMYLGGGISFAASGFFMLRIRVRGEQLRLKRDSQRKAVLNPLAVLAVFKRDRAYARYMIFQMILGCATLAVVPVLPKVLQENFNASYAAGGLALAAAPMGMQIVLLPLLGRLFDRISIFRFRCFGAAMWAASRAILTLGVAFTAMPLVVLAGCITGAGQSFGRLAWTAGHMAFSSDENTHEYMGAHMMMTGIRGMTMPFLGIWLYSNVLGLHIIWISGIIQLLMAAAYWLTDPHRPARPTGTGPSGAYMP